MNTSNPKWWQLYLTFPLLIALFLLDHQLRISARGHEAVQIGIVLTVYGLIYWWRKANSTVLSHMDRKQYYGRILIVQAPSPRKSEITGRKRSVLHIPNSELKGMLSTTFEMDRIDAEALPVEESVLDTKKD